MSPKLRLAIIGSWDIKSVPIPDKLLKPNLTSETIIEDRLKNNKTKKKSGNNDKNNPGNKNNVMENWRRKILAYFRRHKLQFLIPNY